jgi:hypothetical protein
MTLLVTVRLKSTPDIEDGLDVGTFGGDGPLVTFHENAGG